METAPLNNRMLFIGLLLEVVLGMVGIVWAQLVFSINLPARLAAPGWLWNSGLGIAIGLGAAGIILIGVRLIPRMRTSNAMRVLRLLADLSWAEALMLSLLAGIGEEFLFRGAMQEALGIWVTSLVFAALHAYGRLYLAVSFLVSVGLGYLLQGTGHLATVVAAHAVYDFVLIAALKIGLMPGGRERDMAVDSKE